MNNPNQGHYSVGLDKTSANFVPLSPLSFLERTAAIYPDLTSTVHESRSFTWAQTFQRCRRFGSPSSSTMAAPKSSWSTRNLPASSPRR